METKYFTRSMSNVYGCELCITESHPGQNAYKLCSATKKFRECSGDLDSRPVFCPLTEIAQVEGTGEAEHYITNNKKLWVEI